MSHYLHIGLPKTATTTLQKHIFPQFPSYRGKLADGRPLSSYEWWPAHWAWQQQAEGWQEVLSSWASSEEANILLSSEGLTQWPLTGRFGSHSAWPVDDFYLASDRTRPHPVSHFLAAIRDSSPTGSAPKVIVSLRAQATFLASLYAEQARYMKRPSQRDFEAKVAALLAADDPFCDWHALLSDISATVGSENVCILLFEDSLLTNVRRIQDFMRFPFTLDSPIVSENVRRLDTRTWVMTLSSSRGRFGRDSFLRGVLDLRHLASWRFQRFQSRFAGIKRYASQDDRSANPVVTVRLTDSVIGQVRQHFRASNERLGNILERDLFDLGY